MIRFLTLLEGLTRVETKMPYFIFAKMRNLTDFEHFDKLREILNREIFCGNRQNLFVFAKVI
jgi:hypothetical protein